MIKRLVFLVLLAIAGQAFADAPSLWLYRGYPFTGAYVASAGDACLAIYPNQSLQTTTPDAYAGTGGYRCKTVRKSDGYVTYDSLQAKQVCADGSNPDTTKPLAQQCPVRCQQGITANVTQTRGTSVAVGAGYAYPLPNSYQGCAVEVKSASNCRQGIKTGVVLCDFVVGNTGAIADAGTGQDVTAQVPPAPPGDEKPVNVGPIKAPNALSCPAGTVQAGMSSDGVPLCVGTGTNPVTATATTTTTKPEVVSTAADGSAVKKQDTLTTNADGSVTTTTKTTTTAADGTTAVAVTAVTGNTPTGAPGKPGAAGQPGKDAVALCDAHPELTTCQNSTAAASCDSAGAAAVTYTGDAIQGATLAAVKAVQCKEVQNEADLKASSSYTLGTAAVGGLDPAKSSLPSIANASTVTVPSSLDTSGFGSAASPFSDVQFTVQGRSFTLPLAKWSGYLEPLKYVMMVIASLVSFRMLSGAILRE